MAIVAYHRRMSSPHTPKADTGTAARLQHCGPSKTLANCWRSRACCGITDTWPAPTSWRWRASRRPVRPCKHLTAQNRNLSDPAVCTKLKAGMESHAQKINYALGAWALTSADQEKALKVALDLILHLKRGREPSMYSDLRVDPDRAEIPREIVRAAAARDCVRLANDCLAHARQHISEKAPPNVTQAQDKLFTMKSSKFQQMLNTEDFWWYFIRAWKRETRILLWRFSGMSGTTSRLASCFVGSPRRKNTAPSRMRCQRRVADHTGTSRTQRWRERG